MNTSHVYERLVKASAPIVVMFNRQNIVGQKPDDEKLNVS